MEKVNDIKKEDLIKLGFKRINDYRYEYLLDLSLSESFSYEGIRLFDANIHDFNVDTFFVMFSIGNFDIHIDYKADLKSLMDVTVNNIIQTWIV